MSQYNYLDIYRSVAAFTQAVHALGNKEPKIVAFALNDLALQVESEKADKLRQLGGSMNTPTVRAFVADMYDRAELALNTAALTIATHPEMTGAEVSHTLQTLQTSLMSEQQELSRLHDEEHHRAYVAECGDAAERSQAILRQFMLSATQQNEASLAALREHAGRQPYPA